ncbi:hypothetical protein CK203_033680 [Vitis vinifera]|uniref:Uncharacterized protein n=1 Tax=Vitis vinifera TaxID=29760 RepID=A0A438HSL4_VITVI|nr:hypothetical protein CK203_033680 [Vitis vinifera]
MARAGLTASRIEGRKGMLMFHCLRSLTTLLFQMTKRHLRLLFIIIVFSAFITLQASAITDPRDGNSTLFVLDCLIFF